MKQPILKQQPKQIIQQPIVKPPLQPQPLGMSKQNIIKHGIPPQALVQGFAVNRVVVQPVGNKDVKELAPVVPKVNSVPPQRHVLPTGMPVPGYEANLVRIYFFFVLWCIVPSTVDLLMLNYLLTSSTEMDLRLNIPVHHLRLISILHRLHRLPYFS